MNIASYISVLPIAILLLANSSSLVVAADKAKNAVKHHGTASNTNTSKSRTDQNALWSADPDRGWVRSDERHIIQRRERLSTAKETDGKTKGSGKARKRF